MSLDIGMQIAALRSKKESYQRLLNEINSAESNAKSIKHSKGDDVPYVDVTCCPQDLISEKVKEITEVVSELQKEANNGIDRLFDLKIEVKKKIDYCAEEIRELERKKNGNNTGF